MKELHPSLGSTTCKGMDGAAPLHPIGTEIPFSPVLTSQLSVVQAAGTALGRHPPSWLLCSPSAISKLCFPTRLGSHGGTKSEKLLLRNFCRSYTWLERNGNLQSTLRVSVSYGPHRASPDPTAELQLPQHCPKRRLQPLPKEVQLSSFTPNKPSSLHPLLIPTPLSQHCSSMEVLRVSYFKMSAYQHALQRAFGLVNTALQTPFTLLP